MEIKKYEEVYFDDIFELVHKTIEETYPKCYPKSAVDFFHNHHSKENMKKQLPNEFTLILTETEKIIGVGTIFENEVKRFFILPEYQGKGYGKKLFGELEKNIEKDKFDKIILDSSLGAAEFYSKNGYSYKNYKKVNLSDGSFLCYFEMEKNINANFKINYEGKVFVSAENTKNGEVDEKTKFYYHQNKEIIWAEYFGGTVKKGFLLGLTKENGDLEFNYEHINENNEIRTGKCNSTPKISEDGRIKLLENWEWTNGDKSKGQSRIVELLSFKLN